MIEWDRGKGEIKLREKQIRNLDLILRKHWRGVKGFEAREFKY